MKTESEKFKNTVSHNINDIVGPMPDNSGILDGTTPSSSTSSSKWWETPLQDLVSIGTSYLEGLVNGKNSYQPAPNPGTTDKTDNTALYVGIGAGALVFLVIILVLLKK